MFEGGRHHRDHLSSTHNPALGCKLYLIASAFPSVMILWPEKLGVQHLSEGVLSLKFRMGQIPENIIQITWNESYFSGLKSEHLGRWIYHCQFAPVLALSSASSRVQTLSSALERLIIQYTWTDFVPRQPDFFRLVRIANGIGMVPRELRGPKKYTSERLMTSEPWK